VHSNPKHDYSYCKSVSKHLYIFIVTTSSSELKLRTRKLSRKKMEKSEQKINREAFIAKLKFSNLG
jgi:hypothetical protein